MIIGKKARNHPQQVALRGVDQSIDDRRTLPEVYSPLHRIHRFTLDVAASPENAKCLKFFTVEQNGLRQSWAGERVWCNPPYSRIRPWVEKAWNAMVGGCEVVVMLLPANRCEQAWWQLEVEPWRDGRQTRLGVTLTTDFLLGRTRFGRPGWPIPPKGDRPPFGLVVLTWRVPARDAREEEGRALSHE